MKFLYLFDLVRVSQTPAAPTEVKMVAEETILKKLATIACPIRFATISSLTAPNG
jgi:hypothetical protein